MPAKKHEVPHGLRELLLDLTEKVVLARPVNIHLFCAKYLERLVFERDAVEPVKVSAAGEKELSATTASGSRTASLQVVPVGNAIFELTAVPVVGVVPLPSTESDSTCEGKEQQQRAVFQHLEITSVQPFLDSNNTRLEVSTLKSAGGPASTLTRDTEADRYTRNPQLYDVGLTQIIPSLHGQVPFVLVPRPPGIKPPARLMCGWTALQLSRLAGRRNLRKQAIAPDSSRATDSRACPSTMADSTAATVKGQPAGVVGDSRVGIVTQSSAVPGDLDGSNTFDVQSDFESDPHLDWWLDELKPNHVKPVRRRKKQKRSNSHTGRWCPRKRPEIVQSLDSFSETNLSVRVYVDVF